MAASRRGWKMWECSTEMRGRLISIWADVVSWGGKKKKRRGQVSFRDAGLAREAVWGSCHRHSCEVRQIYSVQVASGASTRNRHGQKCSHVTAGTTVFLIALIRSESADRETSTIDVQSLRYLQWASNMAFYSRKMYNACPCATVSNDSLFIAIPESWQQPSLDTYPKENKHELWHFDTRTQIIPLKNNNNNFITVWHHTG